MLVQYTKVSELSEDEKKRLHAVQAKNGFVQVNGKVVSVNELQGLKPAQPQVPQKLFE
jgi:hypothetical protein